MLDWLLGEFSVLFFLSISIWVIFMLIELLQYFFIYRIDNRYWLSVKYLLPKHFIKLGLHKSDFVTFKKYFLRFESSGLTNYYLLLIV